MLLFGLGAMVVMYLINPLVLKLINALSSHTQLILAIVIFIIYFADNMISLKIILNFRKNFDGSRGDNTENITDLVKKELKMQNKLFNKRLLNSFPKLKIIYRKKKNNEKDN